jgi:hypothetical protein
MKSRWCLVSPEMKFEDVLGPPFSRHPRIRYSTTRCRDLHWLVDNEQDRAMFTNCGLIDKGDCECGYERKGITKKKDCSMFSKKYMGSICA